MFVVFFVTFRFGCLKGVAVRAFTFLGRPTDGLLFGATFFVVFFTAFFVAFLVFGLATLVDSDVVALVLAFLVVLGLPGVRCTMATLTEKKINNTH